MHDLNMSDLDTCAMSGRSRMSVLKPPLPHDTAPIQWAGLRGSSPALALAAAAQAHPGLILTIVPDSQTALRLESELAVYAPEGLTRGVFPDWETLPYDPFSPHQDIVSQRLVTLYRLPSHGSGVLIVPVPTLMQRLAPCSFLDGHVLLLKVGDRLDPEAFRRRLEAAGYSCVSQVMEHGEFAVRGSLMDLFPMGAETPIRIDLFDDEVESLRRFDPESQRSIEKIDQVALLPAREFSLAKESVTRFRQGFRARFAGEPQRCRVYREVSNGHAPAGIEYYLPLFFEKTATLFDYLPAGVVAVCWSGWDDAMDDFKSLIMDRYEQRRHDLEQPLLPPETLFLSPDQVCDRLEALPRVHLGGEGGGGFATRSPLSLPLHGRDHGSRALEDFLAGYDGRVLFAADSAGRREVLLETLGDAGIRPRTCASFQEFLEGDASLAIAVAPLEQGLWLDDPPLAVIAESQLFGERASQTRRRAAAQRDSESVIRNLADLAMGAPVVHEDHGVGRYAGLQRMHTAGLEAEFVVVDYAAGGKLYVPVSQLHLLSRYTGAEHAPLHKLGSDQWGRAKRKAREKVRDAAAELLDIHARRQARAGHVYRISHADYAAFAAAFPFEETHDQQAAIEAVLDDLRAPRPTDRVVCGDVGFGKTEVAMRAAFVAVADGRQVAVLVPTTLLAQQHYQNFLDRFADWPVRIEVLSRFRSKKQSDAVQGQVAEGRVDILIGTHKLLQESVKFKNLGLAIIDEEHRFGVRHKERLKALRAEVDILTLTATPIPRTLNLALSGLRDLSIIATPPAGRLAVKTFVGQWDKPLLQEAMRRELKRGGQVYFLHNEVESIQRMTREVESIVPEARVAVAHGQMRERELEQVMLDFYHQRCNVLVCTTIIESGIDVPTANTIIINRADRLGLAQLHQLRGRVGRSHHRAYAYLVVPSKGAMTADAVKRIEAIESLEDLGAGFMLANHDLEIRGAGELLGEEQSGQIHEIGFTLYMELLERAVKALQSGKNPELDAPADHGPEVDLQAPALIPDDYLPDVHTRLMLYKRISMAGDFEALRDLQVEMIDRFGLLPPQTKNLFRVAELKLRAAHLGIKKIEAGPKGGRILFGEKPAVDVAKLLQLIQTENKVYKLDGQDKLRFAREMADVEARVKGVETVLARIT